jgi:hypothetical protein
MWIGEPLLITKAEPQRLEYLVRAHKSPPRMVRRARVVLLAAEGWLNRRIALEVGLLENSVGLWRRRFDKDRMAGLQEMPTILDPELSIQLVLDNGSSHVAKPTKAWLADHPRFVAHYTPKRSSGSTR